MWGSFTLLGTLAYGDGRSRAIETKCGARLAEITFLGNFLRIDMEVKSLLPARAARDIARKPNFVYAALAPAPEYYRCIQFLIKLYDTTFYKPNHHPSYEELTSTYLYNGSLPRTLFTLHIRPVTNERDTCSAFVFTKGFSTYAGGGRKIGGEPRRRNKGENKIKTAPANGCEVREKSTRKGGLMVWRR
ncbi:hypothetical protein O0L34_g6933 [Tuta absoluta]|nr:hypothetical protein O0L34_g6933 [Tuta absoluta]